MRISEEAEKVSFHCFSSRGRSSGLDGTDEL